ncbi:MAG: hypothetical protein KH452_10780 [Clostridiales bacterium]|nr:hypothetical protein [Clostridiales bacterium]
MKELEQWIIEHEPLSPELDAGEITALEQRILAKRPPRRKPLRLVLTLAAAMCLLAACGAAVLGLFDTMTAVNRTEQLVEEYSLTLEDVPSVTVDGHTVTAHAVIRSNGIARLIYDISGSSRQVSSWMIFQNEAGEHIYRIQLLAGPQTAKSLTTLSQIEETGHSTLRQAGPIGKVSDTKAVRYFSDMDIPEDADHISLCVIAEDGSAQVMDLPLPDAIPEQGAEDLNIPVAFEGTDHQPSGCTIRSIRITPFRITLTGVMDQKEENPFDADWDMLIRLFDADGKAILTGKNGSFYSASGSYGETNSEEFILELDSYDLIDPAKVAVIELDGNKILPEKNSEQ